MPVNLCISSFGSSEEAGSGSGGPRTKATFAERQRSRIKLQEAASWSTRRGACSTDISQNAPCERPAQRVAGSARDRICLSVCLSLLRPAEAPVDRRERARRALEGKAETTQCPSALLVQPRGAVGRGLARSLAGRAEPGPRKPRGATSGCPASRERVFNTQISSWGLWQVRDKRADGSGAPRAVTAPSRLAPAGWASFCSVPDCPVSSVSSRHPPNSLQATNPFVPESAGAASVTPPLRTLTRHSPHRKR